MNLGVKFKATRQRNADNSLAGAKFLPLFFLRCLLLVCANGALIPACQKNLSFWQDLSTQGPVSMRSVRTRSMAGAREPPTLIYCASAWDG
jgi:hypothetical protein